MSSSRPFVKWPWVLLTILVIAAQVVWVLGNKFSLLDRTRKEASSWKTYQICGMSLKSPVPFNGKEEVSDLSPQVRKMIKSTQMFNTGEEHFDSLNLTAMRVVYTPEVHPSLDGAAKGAVSRVETLSGVTDSIHTITSKTIAGLPAKHISVSCREKDKPLWLEGDFVIRQQTLYQAIITFNSEDRRADAQRVLDSLQLLPEK